MANEAIVKKQPDPTKRLKTVVEQGLAVLREDKDPARTETCRRSLPLYVDASNRQKVALVSAAKALASLWNIQQPRRASRPPNGMFLQLKCTNGA